MNDMNPEEFRKEGYKFIDWAADYFKNIEDFPVLAQIEPGDVKSKLPTAPPEKGESAEHFLDDLNSIIIPGMTHWNHPGFMAYFNSTASGPAVLGELIAAAFNINAMLWKSNPASTELEEVVISWLKQMFNIPEEMFGIVYDTASISSMHAIAAARERACPECRKKGMSAFDGTPKLRLYASEHAHNSIDKGALAVGIGLEGIKKIPVNANFEMNTGELEKAIAEDKSNGYLPFCVVATIGTTSTTSVDPVEKIAEICKREKIWLHIDSAHAGVTSMLPEMKHHFAGMDKADSIVINPHKWMFVPIDFSTLFLKDGETLKKAFSLSAEYLKTETDDIATNYMDYGVQLGRRFRSLKVWFHIRYFGVDGIRKIIRSHIKAGQMFSKWISESEDFELLAPTPFSTTCFRAVPESMNEDGLNDFNQQLMDNINKSGKIFLSHTKLNGKFTIRFVVSGLRTEEKHVTEAWQLIKKIYMEMI